MCTLDPRKMTWQNSRKVTLAPCSCRSNSRSKSLVNSTPRSRRRPRQATAEMIPSTRSQRQDFTRSPQGACSPASSYVDRTRCQGSAPADWAAPSLHVTGSRLTSAVHRSGFCGSRTPGWAARDRRCWLSATESACTRAWNETDRERPCWLINRRKSSVSRTPISTSICLKPSSVRPPRSHLAYTRRISVLRSSSTSGPPRAGVSSGCMALPISDSCAEDFSWVVASMSDL
mmetsp:Transcript_14163/g.34433  ORF Transcript_14163/g.34433 Transcript_14163/m.34433 type:complete len:231 (-) Transcript_14163:254-946(-)